MPHLRSYHHTSLLALSCLLCAVLCLSSCDKEPSHLSHRRMADVMYDLHLAQAVASEHGDSAAYYERMLSDAVLQKYGLTRSELEQNMQYYTSRPEEFYSVYERLLKRIDEGGTAGAMMVSYTTGDTLSIWPDTPRLLLTNKGRNRATLRFDTDTIVRPGDELELIFHATNIYPEGERNMQAFIRMEYEDSLATHSLFIGGVGYQQETLPLSANHKLKAVSITFLQNSMWSEKVKLLMLNNIHLMCLRPKAEQPQTADAAASDTITEALPDTAVAQPAAEIPPPPVEIHPSISAPAAISANKP